MAIRPRNRKPIYAGDSKPMPEVLCHPQESRDLLTGQRVVLSVFRCCCIVIDADDWLPTIHVDGLVSRAIFEDPSTYIRVNFYTLSDLEHHALRVEIYIWHNGLRNYSDMYVGPIGSEPRAALGMLSCATQVKLTLHGRTPNGERIPIATRLLPWIRADRRLIRTILYDTADDRLFAR
jgi:hypothetical protein